MLHAAPDPRMTELTRIAVLNSHPIQYFAPLYAYLNAAPDLDVTVLYLSDVSIRGAKDSGFGREVKWDLDLLAGYRRNTNPGALPSTKQCARAFPS